MQQYRDTDYAAVSAALHAREAKLLTQAMAERMIDAATPEESYKTLLECGYAPLERCTLENVEHALSQARRELYREVSVLAPDKRIIELFRSSTTITTQSSRSRASAPARTSPALRWTAAASTRRRCFAARRARFPRR